MKRNIDMSQISDGNLYELNDMVKVDCNDCNGCSECCKGMGQSIILDPLDIYNLTHGLHTSFEQLLANAIELNVIDGVILPNLKMTPENEQCHFQIKLKKWIGITDIQKNQEFVIKWHDFITNIQNQLSMIGNEELLKKIDMFILQHFYMEPYNETEDFYSQFDARLSKAKVVTTSLLKVLENQHD